MRRTEWSWERSGGDAWGGPNADGGAARTAAGTAEAITGASEKGSSPCAAASRETAGSATACMLQSGEVGAGTFLQCPAGWQHPPWDAGKYWGHDRHPPHSSVASSNTERPIVAKVLKGVTRWPMRDWFVGMDAQNAVRLRGEVCTLPAKLQVLCFQWSGFGIGCFRAGGGWCPGCSGGLSPTACRAEARHDGPKGPSYSAGDGKRRATAGRVRICDPG